MIVNRKNALAFTTALAAGLLSACASSPSSSARLAAHAPTELPALSQARRAVEQAETAVQAAPMDATRRIALGQAYLAAGRFASAETAFDDAMTLGDVSARAALSLALAQIAQGKYAPAALLLSDWESDIAPADLGLALALAGQPERGIHIMSNAIRRGDNTMKMRQNLAYAFAIAGRWREARLMTQQDVPAGEVDNRIEHWASMISADAYQRRVAELLRVPSGMPDTGLPVHLALGNTSTVQHLAAEMAATPIPEAAIAPLAAPVASAEPGAFARELPALAQVREPIVAQPAATATAQPFEDAFGGANTPLAGAIPDPDHAASQQPLFQNYVSNPIVQPIPGRQPAAGSVATTRLADAAPVTSDGDGSHLVQLGSFLSEQGARRAWTIYVSRYPELASREMVLTQAVVRGRSYWRVSAGGFDRASSNAMCNRVRSRGTGSCVTWAQGRPLPGAVDAGVRLARR